MARLFLPFAPKGKAIELRAIEIKARHGFGPYEAIDPIELANRMGVGIVAAEWFDRLPVDLRASLLSDYSHSWSAGSITVDGMLTVVANPEHSEARRTITLLEELVHEALGHPKSQLIVQDGIAMRTCRHDVEDEGYAVAAALVMPYRELFNHLNAGRPLADLPLPAQVSTDCRLFRVKRAGLWKLHVARQGHSS